MKKLICILMIAACFFCLTACGGDGGEGKAAAPDMEKVYAAMEDKLPVMAPFSAEAVLNYYGIESADCKQMVVSSYYDGADTAEIWLVEAVDAATAKEIEELAQTRLDSMKEQFQSYDPEAYAVVKEAQLIAHGNCVALIAGEHSDDLVQIYKDAANLK